MNLLKNLTCSSLWVRQCEKHWVLEMESVWPFILKAPRLVREVDVEAEQLKCSAIRAVQKIPWSGRSCGGRGCWSLAGAVKV